MTQCIQNIAERQAYVDVCPNADRDHDGICDEDDICIDVVDDGTDSDGDGVGDVCDLCPDDPDATNSDVDGDGIGDACDNDADNDGCLNEDDDEPLVAVRPDGRLLTPGCDNPYQTRYTFAGADSDGDGVLDCDITSTDDDADGIPDDQDICPTLGGDELTLCQSTAVGCAIAPNLEEQCLGNCGSELFVRISSVLDPDRYVELEDFSIVNDVLYVGRPAGMTNSEVARLFQGAAFTDPDGFDGTIRVEVVDRTGALVESLWEFDADTVAASQTIMSGEVTAFSGTAEGGFEVDSTYSLSAAKADFVLDQDGDEVPDSVDNCVERPNPTQADRDRDRFGDACDADFDNSGMVDEDEAQLVADCVQVDLAPAQFFGEPGLGVVPDVAPNEDQIEAWRCRKADLDNDGEVTTGDQQAALELVGLPPGPAGSLPYEVLPTGGDDAGEADTGPGSSSDTGVEPGSDMGPAGSDMGPSGSDMGGLAADDGGGCGCSTGGDLGESAFYALLFMVFFGIGRGARGSRERAESRPGRSTEMARSYRRLLTRNGLL